MELPVAHSTLLGTTVLLYSRFMPISTYAVHDLITIGRKLYRRGLIAGSDGNISLRLSSGRYLMTPSGLSKGHLGLEDLVVIDDNGAVIEGRHKVSSEYGMHLTIYQKRPDVNAIVHAHPPYATAYALAGVAPPDKALPEVCVFVGSIALAEFAPPGTPMVGESIAPYLADHDAILLANHGLVTMGAHLDEAYFRLETVEHYLKILTIARQVGDVQALPEVEVARLAKIRQDLKRK